MKPQTSLDRSSSNLIVRTVEPFNAETSAAQLAAAFLTQQSDFYCRNHGAIPELGDDHQIELTGLVASITRFTVDSLKRDFASKTVVATLQCAGNRRAHLQHVAKTAGDPWDVGAIGNARWTGVALAEVLGRAGIHHDARFVCFTCADEVDVDGDVAAYGISIPIAKALHPDVLLAWGINDEPLLPEHGAPIRLIVPGYAGVRSAKWVTRIEVTTAQSDAPIQAKDYKLFPASVAKTDADWNRGMTIDAMPLNSAICFPKDGEEVTTGDVEVRGYAMASCRKIARVEVSAGGEWVQAQLDETDEAGWAWTQWRALLPVPPGRHELKVRAIDEAGQMQPEHPGAVWNFAGYLSTAWHRIRIIAK